MKALVVYNANPAAATPDQSAVMGLAREDLFTVVMEQFQTDTASYADYILPATTQLEHWDLHRAYGHSYLSLNRPAIEPMGESLSNAEIFRGLAGALGYTDACFQEDDETILRTLVRAQSQPKFATCTWETLLADGYARLNLPDPYLPFAQGNYPTPSGKCEFYSQRMAEDGYDPLPTYESGEQILDIGYSTPADIDANTQYPISHLYLPPRPLFSQHILWGGGSAAGTGERACLADAPDGRGNPADRRWRGCAGVE